MLYLVVIRVWRLAISWGCVDAHDGTYAPLLGALGGGGRSESAIPGWFRGPPSWLAVGRGMAGVEGEVVVCEGRSDFKTPVQVWCDARLKWEGT